jgi:hypothetical protein
MTNYRPITQRQKVIRHSCAKCGSILAETKTSIDDDVVTKSRAEEEISPSCGDSLYHRIIINEVERQAVAPAWEQKQQYQSSFPITLAELEEIPLLLDRGFNVTTYSNGVTIGGIAYGLERPSLVGRGIAKSDEKVNEVEENDKGEKRGEWEFRPISFFRKFEPTRPFGHGISNLF